MSRVPPADNWSTPSVASSLVPFFSFFLFLLCPQSRWYFWKENYAAVNYVFFIVLDCQFPVDVSRILTLKLTFSKRFQKSRKHQKLAWLFLRQSSDIIDCLWIFCDFSAVNLIRGGFPKWVISFFWSAAFARCDLISSGRFSSARGATCWPSRTRLDFFTQEKIPLKRQFKIAIIAHFWFENWIETDAKMNGDWHQWIGSVAGSMLVGLSGIVPLLIIPDTTKQQDSSTPLGNWFQFCWEGKTPLLRLA